MVAQRHCGWIYWKERGGSNFKLGIWSAEEKIAPEDENETVSCTFSFTTSKSSMITRWKMNHMVETMVCIGWTRLSAQWSVRGGHASAMEKSLHKAGEKWKLFCWRLSTAGQRGPANAPMKMWTTVGTSPWRAQQGEMYRIASGCHQQATSYPPDSSCQAIESVALSSH